MSKRKRKVVEPNEPVDIEIDEEAVVEPIVSAVAIGKVVNCYALNIRKKPSTTANVVDTIAEGTEVEVELTESTEDFFRICTAAGSEGWCMRKYIEIIE